MKEKDFSDLDANYKDVSVEGHQMEFHDAFAAPCRLEGFPFVNSYGMHARLPLEVAKKCDREGVENMSMQGAGELIRFRTDSPYVGVRAQFREIFVGTSRRQSDGFDLYVNAGPDMRFVGNRFVEPETEVFTAVWTEHLPKNRFYDAAIYCPPHCAISRLEIGIQPGAKIEAPTPHRFSKPVVIYGSSITNLGAASRPGMTYPAILGRLLDIEVINMGFSGSCHGETAVAEVIAGLDKSVFILEYDHNALSWEFLQQTHQKFYRRFRELDPETPLVMMSRVDVYSMDDNEPGNRNDPWSFVTRRNVILKTYMEAMASGDAGIDFVDGETLLAGRFRYDCTVDGCHPNDLGLAMMGERLADRIRRWLPGC